MQTSVLRFAPFRRWITIVALPLIASCGGAGSTVGADAAADASHADAPRVDAAPLDSSSVDASRLDAPRIDAAPLDSSIADTSRSDASRADASSADASRSDASRADASSVDASSVDGIVADANAVDGDAGRADAAPDAQIQTISWTVTSSGDGNVTISPAGSRTVASGLTLTFDVTSDGEGEVTSTAVGGTCAVGSWNGNEYTTGPITADCSVSFSATCGADYQGCFGMCIELCNDDASYFQERFQFAIGSDTIDSDSCDHAGVFMGCYGTVDTGTACGTVTADCEDAQSTFWTVTSSSNGNVSISPSGPQSVASGLTLTLDVTSDGEGSVLSMAVGGTCPAGAWNGNNYTTGPITADCSVSFSAACGAEYQSCFGMCLELCSDDTAYFQERFQFAIDSEPGNCDYGTAFMGCYGTLDTGTACGTVTAGCE